MVSSPKAKLQRHNRSFPCPVCGGHSGLPQGQGIRCAGFSIGVAVYCTREEYAGRAELDITTEPPAYKHSFVGLCLCQVEHGFGPASQPRQQPRAISTEPQGLNPAKRHTIYEAALDLRAEARADLSRRGLTESDIQDVGYRSLPKKGGEVQSFLLELVNRFGEAWLRRCPGFVDKNGRTNFRTTTDSEGYVVPYSDESGLITGLQFKFIGRRYETA